MSKTTPNRTATSIQEMRLYGLGFVTVLVALFVYNLFTLQPPLTPLALFVYASISLAAVADVLLTTQPPASGKAWTGDAIGWFIAEKTLVLILLLVVAWILRGRAEIYFYLVALDGYGTFNTDLGQRRGGVIWVLGVMALAGLSYAAWESWPVAGRALLDDLPWYGVAVAIGELVVRQWKQRERVERMATDLAEAHQRLQNYVMQAEELAMTQERARLAHEIHDSVGHTMTALDVQLELLARLPRKQAKQRQQIAEQARLLVKRGLDDVRHAVQALRPVALEAFSLPEAIAELIADSGPPVAWQVEGDRIPLPPRLALPLYRAAQEALTNIQRHAPAAQQVTMRLCYERDAVSLTVANDLPPVLQASSPSAEEREEGYGLGGLRERAQALGGEFHARPDGTGNFRLHMRLPLP